MIAMMKQIQNYTIIKQLGEGAFGTTYLAERDGKQVVIKQMKLDQTDHWKALERFHREAEVLKQLNHPGIPNYIDFIETETFAGIVQEYIEGGTLEEFIENRKGKIPNHQLKDLMKQGLEILIYLQSFTNPIVHRDISPKNFLLDRNNKLYLIDFGGVQQSCAYNSDTVTCMGTFGYMAPEQLMGNATPQSDLYSFGMVMLTLITGKPVESFPVDPKTGKLKLKMILKGHSESTIKMITGLVEPGTGKRFQSATEAAYYLKNIDDHDQFAEYIEIVPRKNRAFSIHWMERQKLATWGRYLFHHEKQRHTTLTALFFHRKFPLKYLKDFSRYDMFRTLAILLFFIIPFGMMFPPMLLIYTLLAFGTLSINFRHGIEEKFIQHTLHFTPEGIQLIQENLHEKQFEWRHFREIQVVRINKWSAQLNLYTTDASFPHITKIARLTDHEAQELKKEIDRHLEKLR